MKFVDPYITTPKVRRLFRDPANREDELLIGTALSNGAISPNFVNPIPGSVTRIVGKDPIAKYGTTVYGTSDLFAEPKSRYKENLRYKTILPEKQYDPLQQNAIHDFTALGPGITMAKFSGNGLSTKTSFESRQQVAKYFYLHSLLLRAVKTNPGKFGNYNIMVPEGLYKPDAGDPTPDSILDLQTTGRAVTYMVIGPDGKPSTSGAFEVAHYWKDNALFEKMVLAYDTIDRAIPLTAQIIMVMPEVDSIYVGDYKREVGTEFNYNVALQDGLAKLSL